MFTIKELTDRKSSLERFLKKIKFLLYMMHWHHMMHLHHISMMHWHHMMHLHHVYHASIIWCIWPNDACVWLKKVTIEVNFTWWRPYFPWPSDVQIWSDVAFFWEIDVPIWPFWAFWHDLTWCSLHLTSTRIFLTVPTFLFSQCLVGIIRRRSFRTLSICVCLCIYDFMWLFSTVLLSRKYVWQHLYRGLSQLPIEISKQNL